MRPIKLLLYAAVCIGMFMLSWAQPVSASGVLNAVFGEPKVKSDSSGKIQPKPVLEDKNDYYYLGNGTKAEFLRLKNTYVIISESKTVSSYQLSQSVKSRYGDRVQIITKHSMGDRIMFKVTESNEVASIIAEIQNESGVDFVSPVLRPFGKEDTIALQPEIIVKMASGSNENEFVSAVQAQGALRLIRKLPMSRNEYLFGINLKEDIENIFVMTRKLAELSQVEWAEPNFVATAIKHYTPNDPLYNNQWHLNNTGQGGALPDADIDAPEGWEKSKGSGMVVAVFDDGVETTHEDLDIWNNPGESGGGKETNGVDDDANGYIDDYRGWDFDGSGDNNPNPATTSDNHGTSVAGVAAATGNNSTGVAGSAFLAEILPVRSGSMTCTEWGNAMRYAGKYGDVVSCSWGIGACQSELDSAISDVVNGNIAGARRGTKGTPVLFATGNDASGWVKFSLTSIPAGSHNYTWRFIKDGSDIYGIGYNTVWLDNITWPGGAVTAFDSQTTGTIPSGFTSSGSAYWTVVSDGIHARGASGKSVKAGTITHSQQTDLNRTYNAGVTGTLTYWVWVSCEINWDYFELWVDGTNYHWFTPGQYDHVNEVGYPASNADTIAVGASGDGNASVSGEEERSYYSQFGPEVDVVACSSSQGQGITTTDRTGSAGYDTGSNYYTDFGGTSSATPLTSGIVADILALKPSLTATQLRNLLHKGTDKIGPYAYSSNRNDFYGYGRVNLEKCLLIASGGSMAAIQLMLLNSP